ncbi:hypothetical protein Sjap_021383 [Stephania japonica]|uniref:Uncharacterized protein n=1 Tax=Stephania japonica TaxID=461633 RepID=A0AAP0ELW1_9MAGN
MCLGLSDLEARLDSIAANTDLIRETAHIEPKRERIEIRIRGQYRFGDQRVDGVDIGKNARKIEKKIRNEILEGILSQRLH